MPLEKVKIAEIVTIMDKTSAKGNNYKIVAMDRDWET